MNDITCLQFDELLLDGGGEALARAASHAEECTACLEKWTLWNEISATAPSLRTTWQSDLLWPRIERAIRSQKRATRARVWQVAAALFLTIGLSGVSWYGLKERAEEKAFHQVILRQEALDQVESAEQAHVAAIERLEKLAGAQIDQPTPLMVSYKEKRMMLDDAIAECQTGIEQNRQNAHLRKQLLAIYSEKRRTLHDILREGSNVSNQ